jgi:hypothetical protein
MQIRELSHHVKTPFSAICKTKSFVESREDSHSMIHYGAELGKDVALENPPHILITGRTGGGKGVKGAGAVADAYRLGYKVVVINLIEPEAIHYKYPARGWFAKAAISQGVQPAGIDGVRIWQPAFQYAGSKLPEKIPDWFELFSIPIDDFPIISSENVAVMADRRSTPIVGGVINDMLEAMRDAVPESPYDENTVAEMFYQANKILEDGHEDLGVKWQVGDSRSKTTLMSILYRMIKPRMFCHPSCDIAMTDDAFAKIMSDTEELTVFNFTFLPTPQNNPAYSRFYTMWVLQKIMHYVDVHGDVAPNMVIYIPEAQSILADEKGVSASAFAVQVQMKNFVKEVRKKGVSLITDTQDPTGLIQSFVKQCTLLMFKGTPVNEKLLDGVGLPRTIDEMANLSYDIKDLITSPRDGVFQYISTTDYRVRHTRLPPFDTMGRRTPTNAIGMDKVELMEDASLWRETAPYIDEIEEEAMRHGAWVQSRIDELAAEAEAF